MVFDAHDPPAGLPRMMRHRGLTVHFASRYEDADALIEELIRADSAPRRLTVVSSDHRIQRAARRRRAKAVDSDVWHAEMLRLRQARQEAAETGPARPAVPLLGEEVDAWLRQFGLKDAGETRGDENASESDDPFPPGYADDVEDEFARLNLELCEVPSQPSP